MPDKKLLEISNYSNRILSGLQELRKEHLFSDAILCVGSNQYHCHKAVLASSSPYFRAMFSSPLKESHNNIVEFNEMSSVTLDQILNFVYTGCAEINQDNAQDLLAAANLLQYNEIVEACCDYLQTHLHPSNCLGIEWFSRLHSLPHLEAETQRYTMENFDRVIECDEFLQLPHDRLAWYLNLSEIDVSSEEKLLESVEKWAENRDATDETLCHIYSLIRFNSMPESYIFDIVMKNKHFSRCVCCRNLINRLEVRGEELPGAMVPRPSTLAKDVIVLLGNDPELGCGVMEAFDPMKERWSPLSDEKGLPCVLTGIGIATLGNNIFITGGVRNGEAISEVWCFSTKDHKWIALPNLKEPRAYHSCASWDNCLYIIGGTANRAIDLRQSTAHETVERLDLKDTSFSNGNDPKLSDANLTNLEWEEIAKIPCPRIASSAVCLEGAIIEVGGTQYGIPVKKLETYKCSFTSSSSEESFGSTRRSPSTGEKSTQSLSFFGGEQFILPEIIENAKIVIVEDDLYILWQDTRKMISLNPQKRTFRDLAKPQSASINSSLVAVGDRIYLLSSRIGQVDSVEVRTIEYFSVGSGCWAQVKTDQRALSDIHCTVVKMR